MKQMTLFMLTIVLVSLPSTTGNVEERRRERDRDTERDTHTPTQRQTDDGAVLAPDSLHLHMACT